VVVVVIDIGCAVAAIIGCADAMLGSLDNDVWLWWLLTLAVQ